MAPLEPGSLIVIVGITGYIASHTGLQALKAGYRVRGTARSLSKAEELRSAYQKAGADVSSDKLELVTLNHLMSASQFEAAFAGADGVIHPALPDLEGEDLVDQIIQSVLIPLRAAAKAGIKRFVLSGTLAAVLTPGPEYSTHRVITDQDWNEAGLQLWIDASDEKKKSPSFWHAAYTAGKVLAEREAWKYVDTESPPFDLTVILPNINWGPVLVGNGPVTVSWLIGLLKGDRSGLHVPPQYYVDVRDDAKLHLLALSEGGMVRKRVWAAARPFGWNSILASLRKHFPNETVPEDKPRSSIDPCPWEIDNSLSSRLLGAGWIGLEQSVVDTAKSLGGAQKRSPINKRCCPNDSNRFTCRWFRKRGPR